ncbi:MAG TPA: hypothetical protein DCW90_08200 [Lachnospiraceae bacterium]|nr:hypothetical protein [uncultured Lachnoclostridium sp.]HAU85469.1 hypothetical protein [Lachnospiraceae bacterium]
MKAKVGQYGFLKKQKINYIVKMAIFIAAGLIMYGVGLLVNKGNSKNICTVLAILMALPLAKAFTELVVIFPFHDVELERYEKVCSKCKEQAKLMTGLVITSEKKIMNLDFLVECEGNVIALAGKKEQDIAYISDYLTKGVRNWGFDYHVKVIKEEKAFLHAIETMKPVQVSEIEREHVIGYLESLVVK